MRLAMCNEGFENEPLDIAFDRLAQAGYTGVELAPYTLGPDPDQLTRADRRKIRAMAHDRGLSITGLHWLLARTQGMHVSTDDPATEKRTLQYLRALTELCGDLGGEVLVFGSPGQRSTPPGMSAETARKRALQTFGAWAALAEQVGVTVCLEALPAEETDFMNTTAEVVGLVEAVRSPALRMVLDVKSMSSERTPIPELIDLAAPHLAYVQANDANRRGPGFGDTDFVPIFKALGGVGYDGWISVEAFDFSPSVDEMAAASRQYLATAAAEAGVRL
ncbi:Sugar phosphate isomerase/epimerase [Micromonospora rhizosphaerae]|uniref:Sugar phosphate isomerase/epimerase n=1 Tax=Micromonospora rhizosphaerae TaxID=568872 RepID=A0A1C6T215_9ACTN|nr:sugar phosphate isomerase/epimerase family protein [Micromonospora rhizosphaerae]SCL35689.1 Sugar phosphate isomerase/epimerase [Micromonospora rhizosphaerae]